MSIQVCPKGGECMSALEDAYFKLHVVDLAVSSLKNGECELNQNELLGLLAIIREITGVMENIIYSEKV